MKHRSERQARNEALIRNVNERIEGLNKRPPRWPEDDLFEFLCECGRKGVCEETVQLTLPEYERVRSQDDRFAVYPGHEANSIERVVERNDRYVLVDKIDEAEPLVADDPRGAPSQ
jgi:hypothetical protein